MLSGFPQRWNILIFVRKSSKSEKILFVFLPHSRISHVGQISLSLVCSWFSCRLDQEKQKWNSRSEAGGWFGLGGDSMEIEREGGGGFYAALRVNQRHKQLERHHVVHVEKGQNLKPKMKRTQFIVCECLVWLALHAEMQFWYFENWMICGHKFSCAIFTLLEWKFIW